MTITLAQLTELVEQVEQEDPIDFADLPMDETHLRHNCCKAVMNLMIEAQSSGDPEDAYCVMLASLVKLVVENTVLQARLAMISGAETDVPALLQGIFKKP